MAVVWSVVLRRFVCVQFRHFFLHLLLLFFFLLLTSVPFVGSRIDTSTPFPFILLQCVCVCVCVCECVCVVDLMNGAVAKKRRTNPVTLIS